MQAMNTGITDELNSSIMTGICKLDHFSRASQLSLRLVLGVSQTVSLLALAVISFNTKVFASNNIF